MTALRKIFPIAGLSLFCLVATVCASPPAPKDGPEAARSVGDERTSEQKTLEDRGPLLLRPALAIIRRHREKGTHLDGPRCPMYPSCAAYAERALRRHPLLGLFLTVDRLFFRETGDLTTKYLFAPQHKSHHLRFYDPVEDSAALGEDRRPSLLKEEFRPVR